MTGDDQSPRTLYVGNLSPHVTEDLLIALFGQIGECKSCKIIHEAGNDPYAFVEFAETQAAAAALSAMNKRSCLGKEMKVNWATTSGSHQTKMDSNKHYHIFVGDLAPDIDQQTLRDAFAPFGEMSDVKIMKDPHTLVHKGYGFISFVNKVDAEAAIAQMNGQWLGTRKIRTNWATRKVQPGGADILQSVGNNSQPQQKYAHKLDYNEVWNRSSDNNSTVYCGGINNITEDLIRNTFGLYGQIVGVHPFPDRGYAFVRFASKEAACSAICGVHGMEINGGTAKCSWGKENIDITSGGGGGGGVGVGGNSGAGIGGIGGGGGGLGGVGGIGGLGAANVNTMASMGGGVGGYGGGAGGGNNSAAAAAAAAATAAALAAAQNANSMQAANQLSNAANNAWNTAAANQNTNWANYQWAAATGYPQNTMNYWQGYPGYQNAMMAQQTWGVMPQATTANAAAAAAAANASAQYQQMGQYQQGANGKS